MIWLLRFAALVAALFLLRWLWGWFLTLGWKRLLSYALKRVQEQAQSSAPSAYRGRVKRDPECGTYVDVAVALTETTKGDTVYFCSESCREAYRARRTPTLSRTG